MSNIKLVIEYDGTNYGGWHRQKNAVTVQGVVEDALCRLTGEEINLIGASRTDSGVHALGQVANFHTNCTIPPDRYAYALNSLLPMDIRIRESLAVPESFHARYSAIGKRYRYSIYNRIPGTALYRNISYNVYQPLDRAKMAEACRYLIGTHDFSAFRAAGSSAKTSVRTIDQAEITGTEDMIYFLIKGNGFLYNMVRIIAGTLIDIGKGK